MTNEWLKNDKPLAGQMGDPDDPYGINAVTAGRELDALIAEKVMGEPRPYYTFGPTLVYPSEFPKSKEGYWREEVWYSEGDVPTWRPLRFSTDIAAAWLVVEKWRSKGDGFQLDSLGFDGEEWRCGFMDASNGGMTIHWGEAGTPALAICRAAITAVSPAAPGRADD